MQYKRLLSTSHDSMLQTTYYDNTRYSQDLSGFASRKNT